jgi:hypothetical protein
MLEQELVAVKRFWDRIRGKCVQPSPTPPENGAQSDAENCVNEVK